MSRTASGKRPALVLVLITVTSALVALGAWQWFRAETLFGLDQNLGYLLLWPLFAGFVVFVAVRVSQLERRSHSSIDEPVVLRLQAGAGHRPSQPRAAVFDDVDMARHNRYLAELNAAELQQRLREAGLDVFGPEPEVR
ncbi:hypothetical protein B0T36_25550 [Nocardia donostiensis]|uniref:transcriptional regulator n=1 Tax=Nocardia donostiensis TaxID=1538463 RepID=UPI0009F0AEFB|nr:transcriptional regulator [Nocardia donostiensis]OQS12347.1 hypothetical protein B0T36_25550 [Nocardia donostiensis]